jgi:Tfp pilus assembly protein PilF
MRSGFEVIRQKRRAGCIVNHDTAGSDRIRRARASVQEDMHFIGALLLVVATVAAAQPITAPHTPASDATVLQNVPVASEPAMRRIAALRRAVAAKGSTAADADALARAYLEYGRKVGDAHYAGYAEAVIAPWIAKANPPPGLQVTQATILQYRHEFAPARVLLEQAVRADPSLAQAWLSLASLDMLEGEYTRAAERCARAGRHGGRAVGIACAANVRLYTGDAARGLALLGQVEMPALAAWIEGLRAEGCERLGRWPEAEMHYRKALEAAPGDNYLLVGYADFLLDRGRAQEVVALLADYTESDTTYLRLALAHAAQKSPQAPMFRWTMAARFEAYRQRDSELFGREEARFLLYLADDPESALVAAQRNFERQREPADVRILLEAARAARKPAAAAPAMAFVERVKLEDPVIEALMRDLRGA